jgi:CPA1 family monovalent cation:H+ antiporter
LLLAAFCVVAATLLVQGATLPALVRALGVRGPDPAQDALQQALVLQRAVDAGRERLVAEAARQAERDGRPAPVDVVASLAGWGERIAHSVWERLATSDPGAETPSHAFRRLRVAMLDAERRVVVDVHRSGRVAPEVLEEVMERLDAEEAMLSAFAKSIAADRQGDELRAPGPDDGCDDLRSERLRAAPTTTAVCEDCAAADERDWVSLRMCLRCGHVACCDSSPRRHAEAHFHHTQHPVIRSIELGEAWRWCYVHAELG